MVQYKSFAEGKWFDLSLCEQLGNIGSEVGRAIKADNQKDKKAAAVRALELFDMTLTDKRWWGRGSELARAREVVCDFLFGDNIYRSSAVNLEHYFMTFALAARLNK